MKYTQFNRKFHLSSELCISKMSSKPASLPLILEVMYTIIYQGRIKTDMDVREMM